MTHGADNRIMRESTVPTNDFHCICKTEKERDQDNLIFFNFKRGSIPYMTHTHTGPLYASTITERTTLANKHTNIPVPK